MGILESLATFFSSLGPDTVVVGSGNEVHQPGDIDVSDIDAESISIRSGSNANKVEIQDETIEIYPDELQGEEYARYQQLLRAGKRESGTVERRSEYDQTRALASAWSESIDETIDFFDGLVSDRDLKLLRSCLYLRHVVENDIEYPDFDIHQEKRELRERYGYEAYYFAPLASSGYFDRDRYFRELYHENVNRFDTPEQQFREEFELVIGEKLLAIFVNEDDDPEDVMYDFRSTVAKQLRYGTQTDFVDVCGVGQTCRETINDFIDNLGSIYPETEYENRNRNGERVVRIDPMTLEGPGF